MPPREALNYLMRIIVTAAECIPAVASRRAKYDDDIRVHSHSIILRALRPTHNTYMAVKPE